MPLARLGEAGAAETRVGLTAAAANMLKAMTGLRMAANE